MFAEKPLVFHIYVSLHSLPQGIVGVFTADDESHQKSLDRFWKGHPPETKNSREMDSFKSSKQNKKTRPFRCQKIDYSTPK